MKSFVDTFRGIETAGEGEETIVVDSTALDTGHRGRGIGRYVRGLVGGLDELMGQKGNDEQMAALQLNGGRGAGGEVERAGRREPLVNLETWRMSRPPVGHLLRWGLNEWLLAGELAETGCELYHATEPWAVPVGPQFKTVLTVHDVIPLQFPEHYLELTKSGHLSWRVYYTWLKRNNRWDEVDRIIAISEATRDAVVEHLEVDPADIRVVYNGIDHEQFQPTDDPSELEKLRRRLGLEGPFLLYLGGYDYRKNVEVLVEAMARLRDTDAHLVLAGGVKSHQRNGLERRAEAFGVADRVEILGYIDDEDLAGLYQLATAFVYPSIAEGFGLQLVEAMATGCPVVASDESCLPEVVGDAGLLVDPSDAADVGEAMRRVVEDDQLREQLSERGRRRARRFSWRRCARETLAVYRELFGE